MKPVLTRKLTDAEYKLSRWLLKHGNEDAELFLDQLEKAEATLWKCKCGCASYNFKVAGLPEAGAGAGVHILSDYVFGNESSLAGIFIYSSNGVLTGLEVYGLASDPPSKLPKTRQLKPWNQANA